MTLREACERAQVEQLRPPWHPLQADFCEHAKVAHLEGLLNDERAGWFPLKLYQWAWHNRQTGKFRLDEVPHVVERKCGWRGPPGQLYAAMVAARFLDVDGDAACIHGWEERMGPQYRRVLLDRDRHSGKPANPQKQDDAPLSAELPQSLRGASAELPSLRSKIKELEETEPLPAPEPPPPPVPLAHQPPPPAAEVAAADSFPDWAWQNVQERREANRLPRETRRPRFWERWAVAFIAAHGREGLELAHARFLADPDFAAKRWPTAVFVSGDVAQSRTGPEVLDARRREAQVGRSAAPPPGACCVPECGSSAFAGGLCFSHVAQLRAETGVEAYRASPAEVAGWVDSLRRPSRATRLPRVEWPTQAEAAA